MFRIVRHISLIACFAISMTLLLTGCSDNSLFGPKTQFYGTIKNAIEFRIKAWEPAHTEKIHTMDPGGFFSCELEGSASYIFRAWLPDGTIIAEFEARINQLSGDAPINGVNVDWCWVVGGPFYAAITPPDPSTQSLVTITITNLHPENPNLIAPTVQMYNSKVEMSRAVDAFTESARRNLPPKEVK